MLFAGWWGRLHTRDKDGVTERDGLEAAANNPRHHRHADAMRLLAGPPMPESVEYLWTWLLDIRRGLGEAAMGGLGALTWTGLQAWSALTDTALDPHEAHALFALDSAMRHPESLGETAWT